MVDTKLFSINTYNKGMLSDARKLGLGLEVEEYLWTYASKGLEEKHARVSIMIKGFSNLSFHGTAIDRDFEKIRRLSDVELCRIYVESYGHAHFHGINKIVFHSDYIRGATDDLSWVRQSADFWKRFLSDKPPYIRIYIENFIYDHPDIMARLCDAVDDTRFGICLDTGHACVNSKVDLTEWVQVLGKRVGHVHLHNNDGAYDRHWPLGQGVLDMYAIIEQLRTQTNCEAYVLECDFYESLRWLCANHILGEGL